MGAPKLMPGLGAVAAAVAIVSMISPWGEDDRGTYHGLAETGGSFFGAMVVVAAVIGLVAAGRGLSDGDVALAGGRLRRSAIVMAAGGGVVGPALAQALSPDVAYTTWKASGMGGWLAAVMGIAMVVSGAAWARQQPLQSTASLSAEVDRSFGIGLLIAGVTAIVVHFFGWLTLEIAEDTFNIYGALQDGVRGVGLMTLLAAIAVTVAGAAIVRRFDRGGRDTQGGLGPEHLGLIGGAAGASTALGFLFSIIRNDFDGTVDPEVGLFVYLLAVVLAVYLSASALLIPAARESDAGADVQPEPV